QSSSCPFEQFSGCGSQPQSTPPWHAGSKQSATPLQSLSEPSVQISAIPGLTSGFMSLQSGPPQLSASYPSPSLSQAVPPVPLLAVLVPLTAVPEGIPPVPLLVGPAPPPPAATPVESFSSSWSRPERPHAAKAIASPARPARSLVETDPSR